MTGPTLVAALLLMWAGVAKVARPEGTVRALRAARLPVSSVLVRALAGIEVALGSGVIAVGGRGLDALVALSYATFAAFVGVAMRRGWSLSSCGCFGERDARPTIGHVIADLSLGVCAGIAAIEGVRPLADLRRHPAAGIALAVASSVTAGLVVLVLTRLPALHAEARER